MNSLYFGFALLLQVLSAEREISRTMYFTEDRLPVDGDFKSVYEIDTEKLTARVIYTSELVVRDIARAEQSDRMIAHGTNYDTGQKEVYVINRNGDLIKKFENATRAVFIESSGSRIVYTRGELNKNLLTESRGTWLYNLNTGEEKKIAETGLYLEWAGFNRSVYVSGGGTGAFIYSVETGRMEAVDPDAGGFSPGGTYRWFYGSTDAIPIVRCDTGEVVSSDFDLLNSQRHGTPFYWMNDRILMLPHYKKEIEDYLLFIESGETVKAPGRVLSVTNDEKFVYICKPGLVIEKVAMADLEVLYPGKEDVADEERKSPEKGSVSDAQKPE